jgi:ketosteroid isomerase-like protein
MSEENVEIVRKVLAAWNHRDPDRALDYLAPEIEWEPATPAVLEHAVYRGREEVARATRALWDLWEEFRFEEADVRDLGDVVLWLGSVHIKGSASKVELDQEFAIHVVLRDGQILRAKAMLSRQEGLEAARLRD